MTPQTVAGQPQHPETPRTLDDVLAYYANPNVAALALAKARWGAEIQCLHCGSRGRHSYISTRRIWKCGTCHKQFSPRTGTIFEDSPIGLHQWMAAIWLVANENTISSYRLRRLVGVTQATAQFMLRRIHTALAAREIGGGLQAVL